MLKLSHLPLRWFKIDERLSVRRPENRAACWLVTKWLWKRFQAMRLGVKWSGELNVTKRSMFCGENGRDLVGKLWADVDCWRKCTVHGSAVAAIAKIKLIVEHLWFNAATGILAVLMMNIRDYDFLSDPGPDGVHQLFLLWPFCAVLPVFGLYVTRLYGVW